MTIPHPIVILTNLWIHGMYTNMYVCVCACMYTCVYVCFFTWALCGQLQDNTKTLIETTVTTAT
jgi:hypothetical protein